MLRATLSLPVLRAKPRYLLLVVCVLGLGAIAAAAPSGCENLECATSEPGCVPQRP